MNADGSGQRRLPRIPNYSSPIWSPDGRKIAFVSIRDTDRSRFGQGDIYVMNADGSGQRNLTRNPADDVGPAWSPGQKK